MTKKTTRFLILLEDYFTTYLPDSRGLSINTIISYKQCFILLLSFIKAEHGLDADKIGFSDLTYDVLLEFLDWIEKERHCKPATRNQRLAILGSFSEYAQNRDFDAASTFRLAVNKIPAKNAPCQKRAVFSREEVKKLLALPDESHETGLRDKMILSFMYATGARAQEICDFKVKDLKTDGMTSYVTLTGKGYKVRRIGISSRMAETLRRYIKHRNLSDSLGRYVFSSQTHEQMTVSCVEGIYKKYVSIAKKENPGMFLDGSYSPHSMRHTTACHLLESGVDIVTIKNILGHVSLQTTQIYAEMSQDTVDKKLKEWNETWFGKVKDQMPISEKEKGIPDFLRK